MADTKQAGDPVRAYDPTRSYIENVFSVLTSLRLHIHRVEATAGEFPETDIKTVVDLLGVARRYCGQMILSKAAAYGLSFSYMDGQETPFPEVLELHARADRYEALSQLCTKALDRAGEIAERMPVVNAADDETQKRLLSILSAIVIQLTDLKNRP